MYPLHSLFVLFLLQVCIIPLGREGFLCWHSLCTPRRWLVACLPAWHTDAHWHVWGLWLSLLFLPHAGGIWFWKVAEFFNRGCQAAGPCFSSLTRGFVWPTNGQCLHIFSPTCITQEMFKHHVHVCYNAHSVYTICIWGNFWLLEHS